LPSSATCAAFWRPARRRTDVTPFGKQITFAHFDAVLQELGSRKTVVAGSHFNCRDRRTGSWLMIRSHAPDEIVPDYVMAATRLQLDGRGVIDTKRFDELLQTAAA
jgi:hypothetical protein